MPSPAPGLLDLVRLGGSLGLFLLPGWLLARLLPTPFPVLAAFLGAAAIFGNGVLLLDATGMGLDGFSLSAFLALAAAGLALAGARRTAPLPPPAAAASGAGPRWPWMAVAAVGLGSILVRAIVDPLSGWDNFFRWNYLAELMLRQGSLAHYPPVSAADFEVYAWCDGIPTLVAGLNWLAYVGGTAQPVLTAWRIAAEVALTGYAIHQLARRWWGGAAGWPALAVAAGSPLLLWSFANGQETGLLTLCLASLVLLLDAHRERPGVVLAGWAGVAAGVGATTRDYALAYVLLGGVALAWQRPGRSALLAYLGAAAAVAGPWYLRNAILTGNPVFPHSLGGWLPTNPAHTELMHAIARQWGVNAGRFDPAALPHIIFVLAGPALLLGLVGAWRAWPRHRLAAVAIIVVSALWWWALPATAGGWIYASRVLAPAVALAAALAGWIATAPRLPRVLLALVCTGLAVDAARRAWLLPTHFAAPALPFAWDDWQANRGRVDFQRRPQVWDVLIPAAGGRGIVVDQPADHAWLAHHGGRPVAWFSPAFQPAFDPGLAPVEAERRLRAAGLRFIVLSNDDIVTQDVRRKNPFFRALTRDHPPNVRLLGLDIYDLDRLATAPESGNFPPVKASPGE
jgi:hypothetical protein